MATAKGGEQKTGLIASLVGFVLLAIILAVTTYTGYNEQAAFKEAAAKAKTDRDAMEKQRDWYKFMAVQEKAYIGAPLSKTAGGEAESLTALRGRYEGGQLQGDESAGMAELVKTLEPLRDPKTKTIEGMIQRDARRQAELNNAQALIQKLQDDNKRQKDSYDERLANKEIEAQDYRTKMQKALADLAKTREDIKKEIDDRLAKAEEASVQVETLKKEIEALKLTSTKEKQGLLRQSSELQNQVRKLNDKLTPPDLLKFDKPKGKIVSLDPRGEVAFINLGWADNVRPQQNLTFSVFGTGVGSRVGEERKGAIEVLDVTSEHMSRAKITEQVDPNRNPIVTGDLLVNPAWGPNDREHIAIAGLIDLTGEGRDNIEEFMRNMRQQGVVIDEYLDVREGKRKGSGMNLNTTTYLVLGETPDLGATAGRENDPRHQRNVRIQEALTEMRKEATEKGISIVPLKRFIALTGYRVPRGSGVGNRGFSYESRQPAAPPKQSEPK